MQYLHADESKLHSSSNTCTRQYGQFFKTFISFLYATYTTHAHVHELRFAIWFSLSLFLPWGQIDFSLCLPASLPFSQLH